MPAAYRGSRRQCDVAAAAFSIAGAQRSRVPAGSPPTVAHLRPRGARRATAAKAGAADCRGDALQECRRPPASSSKPRTDEIGTSAPTDASASLHDARKCKSAPGGFTRMIYRALGVDPRPSTRAPVHRLPRNYCEKTWVSLTAGRACRPTRGEERGGQQRNVSVTDMNSNPTILSGGRLLRDNSSAIRFTVRAGRAAGRSVAAITAPSTIGRCTRATRPRRLSSSISTAIRCVGAAEVDQLWDGHTAGVKARSIAARMAATSAHRPPSALTR